VARAEPHALTIIIVTHNSRRDLDGCLGSLTQHPPAVPHEIVVVDNASSDGTPGVVEQRWPSVRLIDAGGNVGFARANNAAVRATAGDLALFLNPDTIVPAGAIDTLIAELDAHPGAAVAGPRVVDGSGRAELSWGAMLSPWAEARQKWLLRANDRGWPWVTAWIDRRSRDTQWPDWVTGACLLIRRADLEAAGLFDERYFLYNEDVDLCTSVRALGRRILFTPAAEITHLRGRSATGTTSAAYQHSHVLFYEKHLPHWAPLLRLYLKLKRPLPDTTTQGR
jgi:GT2 family glycosyltransferase